MLSQNLTLHFHIIPGDDSCKRLLTAGEYRGNDEWQSSGCMMHKYNNKYVEKLLLVCNNGDNRQCWFW